MNFKILIIVLLFNILGVVAQEQRYSYDGREFKKRIYKEFLSKEGRKNSKRLSNDLYDLYSNLPTEESKKNFINLINEFYKKGIFGYKNYREFATSTKKIEKIIDNDDDMAIWLRNYLEMMIKTNINSSKWVFDVNNGISKNKIYCKNKTILWGVKKGKIKYVKDTIQKFSISEGEIFCKYNRKDFLILKDIKGVLNLKTLDLYIEKAKVDWSRFGIKKEEQYVLITNDTINLSNNYYKIKNVSFTSKKLGQNDMKGHLTHRTFNNRNTNKKLVFQSYSGIENRHLSGRYSYKGILVVDGNKEYIINDEINRKQAILRVFKQGKEIFKISSNKFKIDKDKITSGELFFILYLPDSTSISGILQRMIFDYNNKVLFFEKNNFKDKTSGANPINNSFQKMSIIASKVYWNIDSSMVYILLQITKM